MCGPDIHPTTKHSGTADHVMHCLRPPRALLRWSFSPARALIQINRVIDFLGDTLKQMHTKKRGAVEAGRAQRHRSDRKAEFNLPLVYAPALLDQRPHDGDNQDRLRNPCRLPDTLVWTKRWHHGGGINMARATSKAPSRSKAKSGRTGAKRQAWTNLKVAWPQPKQAVSLRIDQDILDWFRNGGPRYQTRINAVLRAFVDTRQGRR